jgi:hypothetical protein
VLVSGGVGAAPAWSATPTLTSLTLTAGSGSQTGKVPVVIFTSTTPGANVSSAETDLISYPMPANTLAVNGQKLRITIFGTTAANANGKTVRFYFGGTMIGASGISVAYNGLAWQATAYVIRTGAAHAGRRWDLQPGVAVIWRRGHEQRARRDLIQPDHDQSDRPERQRRRQ